MLVDRVRPLHGVGVRAAAGGEHNLRLARLFHHRQPVDPRLRSGGDLDRPRPARDRPAVLDHAGDVEPLDLKLRSDRHRFIGVVVEDAREGHGVADDEEPRPLEAGDERPPGPGGRAADPELVALRGGAGGRLPSGQRVGVLDAHRHRAVLVGDEVRLPEDGGAEIAAHHDRRLGAGLVPTTLAVRWPRHPRRHGRRGGDRFVTHFHSHGRIRRRVAVGVGVDAPPAEPPRPYLARFPAIDRPLEVIEPAILVVTQHETGIDELILVKLHQLHVALVVEGARGPHDVRPLPVVEEELPRVRGVVLLDVVDRFIDERKRHLGHDGAAVDVASGHRQQAFILGLVGVAVGSDLDLEEVLHRRHDDVLAVDEDLTVADHHGVQIDVGDVPLADRQRHELDGAGDVDDLVVVQVVTLDREEHVAVVGGNAQHDRRGLPGAEGVLVDDDLDAALAVSEVGGGAVGHPHRRLGGDGGGRITLARRDAPPRDAVVAVGLGGEGEGGLALGVGRELLGEDVLRRVAAELESPGSGIPLDRRGKDLQPAAGILEGPAGDFPAGGIEPHLDPPLAGHLDRSRHRDRLVVGVEGLEIDLDLVAGPVEVVLGPRIDVVPLPRHPDGVGADDLPARGVGDAGLDPVLEVLAAAHGGVEGERDPAGAVGLERLLLDDLARTAPIVRRPLAVVPGVVAGRHPVVIERLLVDEHGDVGVGHRPAEVVIGFNGHLDGLADAEGLLAPLVVAGRGHRDLELRQLVLLEAKELGVADRPPPLAGPEGDLVLAEGHRLAQLEPAPGAAEGVERELALVDLAAGAGDLVRDDALLRRGVARSVVGPGGDLPLNRLARAVGGPIGARVDLPRSRARRPGKTGAGAEGLAITGRGGHQEAVVPLAGPGLRVYGEPAQPLAIGLGDLVGAGPALVEVAVVPQAHPGPGNG